MACRLARVSTAAAVTYYDRAGLPIDQNEWAERFATDGYRQVAYNVVGDVAVSTVWLGLDHGYGGPPLIFETMIFGGPMDHECWRWPSEAAAIAGHDQALALVADWAGRRAK